jgi:hypothetical protein
VGDPAASLALVVFPVDPDLGLLNASGPCIKALAFLKLTGLPHTVKFLDK